MMINNQQQPASWWGDYSFLTGQTSCWDIGPLTMFIRRLEKEWNVIYKSSEAGENIDSWQYNLHTGTPPDDYEIKRYVFADTADRLTITPLLADRSVVIKPEIPFHVPTGQETTLFVSTPLWLRVQVHEPSVNILDMPIMRPSDTWFGPSTMEGELCYASRTLGRLSLDDFPYLPHRAVTPVTIRNNTDEAFQLERLNLTMTYLSLYCSSDHHLWTEAVTMVREPDTSAASIQIGEGAPEQAIDAALINEPREKAESRSLLSKVSTLFG
jgi:hypothetical protein